MVATSFVRIATLLRPAVLTATLGCAAFGTSHAQAQDDLAGLASRLDALERGVAGSEAVKAVKRLQHAYGHYLEHGLWNDFADLFAQDAVAYYPVGTFRGRDAIRGLLFDRVGGGKLGLDEGRLYSHLMLAPVVTLDADGKTARGRWHQLGMNGQHGVSAEWSGGIHENVYVQENGVWKIAELHLYSQFGGPYAEGWRNLKEEAAEDVAPVPFHYDSTRAGIPSPLRAAAPAAASGDGGRAARTPATLETLATKLADLERRLARMNEASQVQNLQNAYGYYVDRKMWDDVAALFTNDATLELGARGVYRGAASIRRALEQFGPQGLARGELNDRLQLQTVVTIAPDGRTAFARGLELGMVGKAGGDGRLELGIFENRYVEDGGVWKIAAMHVYTRFVADYAQGWALGALPAPTAPAEFPADAPPTERYAAYPAQHVPAFHFANPATGRAPQYPAGTQATRTAIAEQGPPLATPPRSLEDLRARIAAAETALAVARAYDGAENIANAYGYYIDEFLWHDMADVFAENGWKELSYIGTYVGRERIRESTIRRYRTVGRRPNSLVIHQKTQPVITVAPDGSSARIRTRLFQINSAFASAGSWLSGVYENKVVLEDGVWKIQEMDLDYTWTAGYAGGWAGVDPDASPRPPAVGGLPDFPPDRALRGVAAAPFPDVAEMRFHYANPVTGRGGDAASFD